MTSTVRRPGVRTRRPVAARAGAALAALALLAAGCSSPAGGPFLDALGSRSAADPAPGPSGQSGSATCPSSYAAPDPDRPKITLAFDLADDLKTVRGTEDVVFTPDLPVRELVFRLTANTAPSVREGNRVQVSAATADPAGAPYRFQPAGAGPGTQGGLLIVPLAAEVPAGQQVRAHVEFTLTLGDSAFDRFGRLSDYAWWGSGQPLLAWERGVGWHQEPLLQYTAESATSEAAQIDLSVTAPARFTVLSSGTQDAPAAAGAGHRRWHAVADRARDVSVAVGPFQTARSRVAGTTLVVATAPGKSPAGLLREAERGVQELTAHFGPAPFPVISLTRLPIGGGGIEYPGSILMLDDSRTVTVHELAHQWFYAMVGNSQARDPWLDEAFASFAEGEIDGVADDGALRIPGRVGASTDSYGPNESAYYATTYAKGSAALTAARNAGPPAKFDAALHCYINANAWRIAKPADLAAALAGLPASVKVLQEAGALP
ncbi:MAG TPA: M1 family aminopeptidase [Mycobacteriales bacterium]|nr:M1 family aminopeptidase [Mycobacteriales bacterium]